MKSLVRDLVRKSVHNELLWSLYRRSGVWGERLSQLYRHAEAARNGTVFGAQEFIVRSFPDLVVRNGPFKGMRYPSALSAGSAILPKLLGSYEWELKDVLAKILERQYSDIVDIGCAEGYYAAGLGLRFPDAKIYGFDTDPRAQDLCRQMAALNGVADRLTLGDFCDEATLLSMQFRERALVISDCEGYEKRLFTPEVARFLAPHDVLIEVHDLIDPDISSTLKKTFAPTHDLTVVKSIDDAEKAWTYDFEELAPYTMWERLALMAERRSLIMQWFFLTPKAPGATSRAEAT